MSYYMTKVLVTGNLGFVGSHLSDYLIEQGYEVVGIDNLLTGDEKNGNPKVKQYIQDLVNFNDLTEMFSKEKPDWVFHTAANCRTGVSVQNPIMDMENNIRGTLNVLLASRDHGVKKVIQSSSCILNAPNTPYYVSKLASEEYTQVFNKIYNLPTISLRYSNVYGSLRQSEQGPSVNAIASLRKTKRETGRIWITGDGTQVRDWSHVKDICRANLIAAKSDKTGVFDICTGVQTSMNEVAKFFNCPIDHIEPRVGDAPHLKQDPTKAKEELGYIFEIPFGEESMRPYIE